MKRRYQVCMAVPLVFDVEAWTPDEARRRAFCSTCFRATPAPPPDGERRVLWTQEQSTDGGDENGR